MPEADEATAADRGHEMACSTGAWVAYLSDMRRRLGGGGRNLACNALRAADLGYPQIVGALIESATIARHHRNIAPTAWPYQQKCRAADESHR
jgi:hypothetical protein